MKWILSILSTCALNGLVLSDTSTAAQATFRASATIVSPVRVTRAQNIRFDAASNASVSRSTSIHSSSHRADGKIPARGRLTIWGDVRPMSIQVADQISVTGADHTLIIKEISHRYSGSEGDHLQIIDIGATLDTRTAPTDARFNGTLPVYIDF